MGKANGRCSGEHEQGIHDTMKTLAALALKIPGIRTLVAMYAVRRFIRNLHS